jgi:SAM-dependent methyltransferase
MSDSAVTSMALYYAQRAASYEAIYAKPERQADLRVMEQWLGTQFVGRQVLEIACGTGWWTAHGAGPAQQWLATDINPETLAVARSKAMPASVQFATVDAYSLAQIQGQSFDAVFAGFWWSHVPLQRLAPWLELLHSHLRPGARVVFLDNRYVPGSSTPLSRTDAQGNSYQNRSLEDGSIHEVLKNFPTAEQAFAQLGPRATQAQWLPNTHYWIMSYQLN